MTRRVTFRATVLPTQLGSTYNAVVDAGHLLGSRWKAQATAPAIFAVIVLASHDAAVTDTLQFAREVSGLVMSALEASSAMTA